MPLMIIPIAGYGNGGSGVSSQELNALSSQLSALSQRITLIEEALQEKGIDIDPAENAIEEMLDNVFAGDLSDDDNPQDPEYIELLDDVFFGKDTSDPDGITDDDAELFGDFDDIFNP